MARIIFLDSGPAGLACDNPNKSGVKPLHNWMAQASRRGRTLIVLPEIVAYELRRNLLLTPGGAASAERLDRMTGIGGLLVYAPITTPAMRLAAELWAGSRRGGMATADPHALDGDAILAAQALCYVGLGDELRVATDNRAHLSRFIGDRARAWTEITP